MTAPQTAPQMSPPNPPKPPMVVCPHCGSRNEADRSKCRNCQQPLGNFNQHRTSWLVISVLRGLRTAPALFDEAAEVA